MISKSLKTENEIEDENEFSFFLPNILLFAEFFFQGYNQLEEKRSVLVGKLCLPKKGRELGIAPIKDVREADFCR